MSQQSPVCFWRLAFATDGTRWPPFQLFTCVHFSGSLTLFSDEPGTSNTEKRLID